MATVRKVGEIYYYWSTADPTATDGNFDHISIWKNTTSGAYFVRAINDGSWVSFGSMFDLAAAIHAATTKTPPVDADEFGFWDSVSGLLRKCTWANFKSTLKSYFDGIYGSLSKEHDRTHSVTSTSDHTFPVSSGKYLKDDGTWDAPAGAVPAHNDTTSKQGGYSTTEFYHETQKAHEIWSGFASYGGSGNYWSLSAAGLFTMLRAGEGIVNGAKVTWTAGQTVSLTANKGYFIVINSSGTLAAIDWSTIGSADKETFFNNFSAMMQGYILLFSIWYDGHDGIAVKNNHPYNYLAAISMHDHFRLGSVFLFSGAIISALSAANRTIQSTGADLIDDHGVLTNCPDGSGVAMSTPAIWRNGSGLAQRMHRRNFTVSGVTTAPTAGAVYSDNTDPSNRWTVLFTNAGKTTVEAWGSTFAAEPAASGTLTKVSGTGDASITYSAVAANRVTPCSYVSGGVPVPLGTSGSNKFGIYAVYALPTDMQTPSVAAPVPQYIVLLPNTAYASESTAANSLGTGSTPTMTQFVMPTEIEALEPVLMGFVMTDGNTRQITTAYTGNGFVAGVRVLKQTASSQFAAGAVAVANATNVATDTSAFAGILTAADTTVQKALDTIDDHTHAQLHNRSHSITSTSDHSAVPANVGYALIGDANGLPTASSAKIFDLSSGGARTILQLGTGGGVGWAAIGGTDYNNYLARIDIGASQIYLNGGAIYPSGFMTFSASATATSFSAQKASYYQSFIASMWTGKAAYNTTAIMKNTWQNVRGQQTGFAFFPGRLASDNTYACLFLPTDMRVGVNTMTPDASLSVQAKPVVQEYQFSGSGLEDMNKYTLYTSAFTGTTNRQFKVQIDGTGSPNTFKWSKNGGTSWDATGVSITGSDQLLTEGVNIKFGATTGHTLNDYWIFDALYPDVQTWRNAAGTQVAKIDSAGNVNIAGLTASRSVFTDANKNLVSGTNTDTDVASAVSNKQSNIMSDPIPIGFCADGVTAAPDAIADFTNGNWKNKVRKFSGTANQDVNFEWPVDDKIDTTYKVQFCVEYVAAEATPPANGEVVSFKLSGYSIGDGDATNGTFGTAVASSYTHAAGESQYDRYKTAWSGDVTITDLAAGETAMMNLIRDATGADTYAQKVSVFAIHMRWKKIT